MEKFTFTVLPEDEGKQIKKLLRSKYGLSSRMMTKIKYGDLISINGERVPGWRTVKQGDSVTLFFPDEKSNFEPEDIPISPLYEDEDFLIINKQAGVTVHPTKGHPDHTIANGIMKYMKDTDSEFKVRFVNRLDMDTSGVLVIAKNAMVQADLNRQMAENKTIKEYIALVSGIIGEENFLIDLPIGSPAPGLIGRIVKPEDEGGFPSKTEVTVLERFKNSTMIRARLHTGRTHQIRVHLSHIGHPLIGDSLYGESSLIFNRQALHAERFSCTHPITGEILDIHAPLPDDLKGLIDRLRRLN